MKRLVKRLLTGSAALGVALGGSIVMASSASASGYDDKPCGEAWQHPEHGQVQNCPLWRGNVPVYQFKRQSSEVVGYLYEGGNANWFKYQNGGSTASLGSYENHWWAKTIADNGQEGWVPEVYFAGGGNDRRDSGLRVYRPAPTNPAV